MKLDLDKNNFEAKLDFLETSKNNLNIDFIDFLKNLYEFTIICLNEKFLIPCHTEDGEELSLSLNIFDNNNIYGFLESKIENIIKDKFRDDKLNDFFQLNTLLLKHQEVNNSVKFIVFQSEFLIDNVNNKGLLNLENFTFYIKTRLEFVKYILINDDYLNNQLGYQINNPHECIIIHIKYLCNSLIIENKFTDIYKTLYEELEYYHLLGKNPSIQLNSYVSNIFLKILSYNNLFQLEPINSIKKLYHNYSHTFNEQQVNDIENFFKFSPIHFQLMQITNSYGDITQEQIPDIKTSVSFIVPFEFDENKGGNTINISDINFHSFKGKLSIVFQKVDNLFFDPVFLFHETLPNNAMIPFIGDFTFPIHYFTDAYPNLSKNTTITINFDSYFVPQYNIDIQYWETITESYFHPYKYWCFNYLYTLIRQSQNLIPLKLENIENFTPKSICNFMVMHRINNDVVKQETIMLTNKNAYTSFKQRFLNRVNSLNIEYELNNLRKLLLQSEINHESDLLNFTYNLFDIILRDSIQNKEAYQYLWETSSPIDEPKIQPLVYSLIEPYCNMKGIQISREVILANGKLDFLCSYTNSRIDNLKLCIEMKKAEHPHLLDGLKLQLPKYMEASKTNCGIFLVFWFKGANFTKPDNFDSIKSLQDYLESNIPKGLNIKVMIIDCHKPISPSNLRS